MFFGLWKKTFSLLLWNFNFFGSGGKKIEIKTFHRNGWKLKFSLFLDCEPKQTWASVQNGCLHVQSNLLSRKNFHFFSELRQKVLFGVYKTNFYVFRKKSEQKIAFGKLYHFFYFSEFVGKCLACWYLRTNFYVLRRKFSSQKYIFFGKHWEFMYFSDFELKLFGKCPQHGFQCVQRNFMSKKIVLGKFSEFR